MKLKRTKTLTTEEVEEIARELRARGLKDGQGLYHFDDAELLIVKDDETKEFCAYIKIGDEFSFVERIARRLGADKKDYLYFATESYIPNGKEIERLPKIPVETFFADGATIEIGDKLIDIFKQPNFSTKNGAFKQKVDAVGKNIKDENNFRKNVLRSYIRLISQSLIHDQIVDPNNTSAATAHDKKKKSDDREVAHFMTIIMQKAAQGKELTDKEIDYWTDRIAKNVAIEIRKKYGEKSTAEKAIYRDLEFFKTLVKQELIRVKDELNSKYHPKQKAAQPTRGTIGYDKLIAKADGFLTNNRAVTFEEISVGLDAGHRANDKTYRIAFEHVKAISKDSKKRDITPKDIKDVKEIEFKIGLLECYAIAVFDQILTENASKKNVEISEEEKNNLYNHIRESLIAEVITEEDIENLMARDVISVESEVNAIVEEFKKDATAILESIAALDSVDERILKANEMEEISNFVENHPYLKELEEEIGIEATQEAWREYFLKAAQDEKPVFVSGMGESSSIHHSDIPTIDAIAKAIEMGLIDEKYDAIHTKTVSRLLAPRDYDKAKKEEHIIDHKEERRAKRAEKAKKEDTKNILKAVAIAGAVVVLATGAFALSQCEYGGNVPVGPDENIHEQTKNIMDFIGTDATKEAVFNALKDKSLSYNGQTYQISKESKSSVIKSVTTDGTNVYVRVTTDDFTAEYKLENISFQTVQSQAELNKAIPNSTIEITNATNLQVGPQGQETVEHNFSDGTFEALVGEDENVLDGYIKDNKVYLLTENHLYEYALEDGVDASKINDEELRALCENIDPTVSDNCKQDYIDSWVGQGIISQDSLDKRIAQAKTKVPGAKTFGISANVKAGEDGKYKYDVVTLTYVGLDDEGNVVGVYNEKAGSRVYFKGEPDEATATVLTVINMNGGDILELNGACYGFKPSAEVSSDMFATTYGMGKQSNSDVYSK